jgi:hypothetical protein
VKHAAGYSGARRGEQIALRDNLTSRFRHRRREPVP